MSGILWNLFGKIWIQNVGDIDFKVICAAQNSNQFPKTRFWKEKSVEDVITLERAATLVSMEFQKGHESGEGQIFWGIKILAGSLG